MNEIDKVPSVKPDGDAPPAPPPKRTDVARWESEVSAIDQKASAIEARLDSLLDKLGRLADQCAVLESQNATLRTRVGLQSDTIALQRSTIGRAEHAIELRVNAGNNLSVALSQFTSLTPEEQALRVRVIEAWNEATMQEWR